MSFLDDSGIDRCHDCGKLIAPGMPEGRCSACRSGEVPQTEHGADATRPVGTLPGLPTAGLPFTDHEVREAMRDMPSLARYLGDEPTCPQCQRRPPMEGMRLCLRCQIDALDMLRQAASEAYEHVLEEQEEAAQHRPRSVPELLEEKRARTSTANIDPSGAQKVKNYRYN